MEDIAITDLGASARIQFAEWRAGICESAAEVGPSLKGLFKREASCGTANPQPRKTSVWKSSRVGTACRLFEQAL